LSNQSYDALLPLQRVRRVWASRIRQVELPVFPGYVFSQFDPNRRLPILQTPGVVEVVRMGRDPVPIQDFEISSLQALAASGLSSEPWDFLEVGKWVRVANGPLKGATGRLVAVKNSARIVLSATILRRAVLVEIDRDWVVPCSDPQTAATIQ
jgi:transcription antitermination factor NusG